MSQPAYRLFNVELKRREQLSPALTRFVFGGPEVAEMKTLAADQRIKIFFPDASGQPPSLPGGSEWYQAYRSVEPARRPPMRTYTIRALRAEQEEVDVEFVLHGENGPASAWATHARIGDRLQLAAPNRQYGDDPGGYEWKPPAGVRHILLIADETALPAVAGILEELAGETEPPVVEAFLEVPGEADILDRLMGRFVGKQADGYETRIGRLLPGYELLHLLSRAQLLARLPERARLLSVGCGAGGELAELAGLRPGWRFVAADLSADMLALARQRCARLGLLERIELHCGDVAGLPPAPPCDAALVLLVLHFLRGDQAKRRFLEAVAERLAPAAPLLLANLMEARDAFERPVQAEACRLAGLSPEDSDGMLQRLREDFDPLSEQRLGELLEDTGFVLPSRYFQAVGYQAWIAFRAG